jgi:hypothetical protein
MNGDCFFYYFVWLTAPDCLQAHLEEKGEEAAEQVGELLLSLLICPDLGFVDVWFHQISHVSAYGISSIWRLVV